MERASPEGRSPLELHVRERQSVALAPSGHAEHLFGPIFRSKTAYDLEKYSFTLCHDIYLIAVNFHDRLFVLLFLFFSICAKATTKKIKSVIHALSLPNLINWLNFIIQTFLVFANEHQFYIFCPLTVLRL